MKHPKHSSDYWQEGYDAAWNGRKRTSNPYPMRKAEVRGLAWDEGWRSASLSIELGYLKPRHRERRRPHAPSKN